MEQKTCPAELTHRLVGGKGFFLKNLYLFIYLCRLHWVFVAARGLSLVVASGGYSSLWCAGFLLIEVGGDFTCCRERASVVVAHGLGSCGSRALERRLNSCGARA